MTRIPNHLNQHDRRAILSRFNSPEVLLLVGEDLTEDVLLICCDCNDACLKIIANSLGIDVEALWDVYDELCTREDLEEGDSDW